MPRVTHAPTRFACARRTKLTSIFIGTEDLILPVADQRGQVSRTLPPQHGRTADRQIVIGPLVYVRIHGPTKYAVITTTVFWSTRPNGSLRRCDADAKSFAHFNKDGRRSMRHAMPSVFGVRSRWRMAGLNRPISRCSLLKGGHSRRLH
jgi:hypothetical protein